VEVSVDEDTIREIEEKARESKAGIPWEKFKPAFDSKEFARRMRQSGFTSAASLAGKQPEVLGILRQSWQAELANLNEFVREHGTKKEA
jgi:hypothetical protein